VPPRELLRGHSRAAGELREVRTHGGVRVVVDRNPKNPPAGIFGWKTDAVENFALEPVPRGTGRVELDQKSPRAGDGVEKPGRRPGREPSGGGDGCRVGLVLRKLGVLNEERAFRDGDDPRQIPTQRAARRLHRK